MLPRQLYRLWSVLHCHALTQCLYIHVAGCPENETPIAEKEQAAKDWSAILKAIAKELVPGRHSICANFCVSSEGYFLGKTDVGVSMWDSFQSSWDKLKEGYIVD